MSYCVKKNKIWLKKDTKSNLLSIGFRYFSESPLKIAVYFKAVEVFDMNHNLTTM